jgi:hypothetical protein
LSARNRKKVKRTAFKRRSRQRKPGDAHTILSFCAANHISESFYHSLKRKGCGPREIELLDKRIIITPEAEANWRCEREAETQRKREAAASSRSTVVEALAGQNSTNYGSSDSGRTRPTPLASSSSPKKTQCAGASSAAPRVENPPPQKRRNPPDADA